MTCQVLSINAWPRVSSQNLAADIISRKREEREQYGACVHPNRVTIRKSCRKKLKMLFLQGSVFEGVRWMS